jgi:hypothetical protein
MTTQDADGAQPEQPQAEDATEPQALADPAEPGTEPGETAHPDDIAELFLNTRLIDDSVEEEDGE